MKKLTLYTTACMFLVSSISSSQIKSPIKNKLSLVYDLTYKVSPVLINDNYNFSDVGLKNWIKNSAKEHSFTANYKLLSRLSVSLTGGYIRNRFYLNNYTYYNNNPEAKIPAANGVSYGVGINLFFKKGLAPTDSHLGIVLKQYSYKLREVDVVNAIYANYLAEYPDEDKYTANGDSKMNVTYFGLKYNYTRMISKNLPVFWNVGVNLLIPVKTNITLSEISIDEDPNNYNYYYIAEEQSELLRRIKNGNIFKINMGIGYIF